jgi:hypothetical protein
VPPRIVRSSAPGTAAASARPADADEPERAVDQRWQAPVRPAEGSRSARRTLIGNGPAWESDGRRTGQRELFTQHGYPASGFSPAGGSLPPGEPTAALPRRARSGAGSPLRQPEVRLCVGSSRARGANMGSGARAPAAATNGVRQSSAMGNGGRGLRGCCANVLVRADMDCADFETPRRGRRPAAVPGRGPDQQRTAWLRSAMALSRDAGAGHDHRGCEFGRLAAAFDDVALSGAHHLYPQQLRPRVALTTVRSSSAAGCLARWFRSYSPGCTGQTTDLITADWYLGSAAGARR